MRIIGAHFGAMFPLGLHNIESLESSSLTVAVSCVTSIIIKYSDGGDEAPGGTIAVGLVFWFSVIWT